MRLRARVVVGLLVMTGCTPNGQGAALRPEFPVTTRVHVDMHVHSSLGSNDTDGLGTPEALRAQMAVAGLDLVFLTDHSNCLGSMDCDDVEDCPNQGPERTVGDWDAQTVWLASELSPVASLSGPDKSPRGHVGCIPLDRAGRFTIEAFTDRPPGEVSGGESIDQCHEAGGWAVLNHPYGPVSWVAFDNTSEAYDAIEVYNGGARFDPSDAEAFERWRTERLDRPTLVAVGGSDSHRWRTPPPGDALNPPLGWPINDVFVGEGQSVLDAIRAGHVVVREPTTQLSLVAEGVSLAGGVGDLIDIPAHLTAVASSEVEGLVLRIETLEGDLLASQPIEAHASEPTRLEVTLTREARVIARVWPANDPINWLEAGIAFTNPITLTKPD